MSKSSRSGGVRKGKRVRALSSAISIAILIGGCGGRTLTATDDDARSGGGASSFAGLTGYGGFSAGSGQGGSTSTAGAYTAGASAAGAPVSAGSGSTGGCIRNAECDDGNPCTNDGCDNGVCRHQLVALDDGNACTVDTCDPTLGVNHSQISFDDHDYCTKDTCAPQSGPVHTPYDFSDKNPCTADVCDPKTGSVTHQPLPSIADGDPCTWDLCDPMTGMVSHPPSFNDGNACTADTCDPKSGATLSTPIDCDDSNPCTVDSCDPTSGCQHSGGVYYIEDFSGGGPGWDVGPSWQVGPAQESSGQTVGNADPAQDHSPTLDNRLAGVEIGGNASTVVQGPNYLTSPAIDLSAVPGSVTLEYWRWLNSDFPPYMSSTVEVFDGNAWLTVYSVPYGSFIGDTGWGLYQFDVTAYKNANFRARWGWSVNTAGAYTVSSWNIDDVRVISNSMSTCP